MKKIAGLIYIGLLSLVNSACSPRVVYVPVETDTHVEYRDSIIYKIDTLRIAVPVETVREVVPAFSPLHMETSVAEADAWVDTTTNTLKGSMRNKNTQLTQPQVVYKEKIQYRDSIRTQEVPVPVEVEKRVPFVPLFWRIFSVIGIVATFVLALFILRKL